MFGVDKLLVVEDGYTKKIKNSDIFAVENKYLSPFLAKYTTYKLHFILKL